MKIIDPYIYDGWHGAHPYILSTVSDIIQKFKRVRYVATTKISDPCYKMGHARPIPILFGIPILYTPPHTVLSLLY